MDVQVAQPLFDAINTATQTQLGNVTLVMSVMGIVIGGGWMIYILMKAITWHFMAMGQIVEDIVMTMIKGALIMFMAFSVAWYTSTVVPVVTDFPVWLGNTISGASGVNNNLVDALISSYITSITETIKAMDFSPISNFKETFFGVLSIVFLLLGGIPFLGVAIGTLITLKCASSLILVVGPIFIAIGLFPKTQQYFWGWLGVLGGFALAQALFAVVIGMEMAFINTSIVKGGKIDTDLVTCFSMLLYFGAFTLLATEIPNYAAAIMGGTPTTSTGAGGIIGRGTGLGAATKMGMKMGKALMKRRGNRIK
ncbi:type IV secretion system protein [Rahnella sp. ChDrAdgB13]|uniref:type IV secretion system protein n=1 Tax=Rahnella sp. ChDrAdgB13 TaxID=1850581 RepID=UPI001AD85C48|nr:type IV secretion system protein [Rahnella sp. ChDrAdgB13]